MATRQEWNSARIGGAIKGIDARVKLTPSEREQIRDIYKRGAHSQRELARMYNVARRLIVFCIHPERREQAAQYFKKRSADRRYYNKDKQREYMRVHRKNLRRINTNL